MEAVPLLIVTLDIDDELSKTDVKMQRSDTKEACVADGDFAQRKMVPGFRDIEDVDVFWECLPAEKAED